MTEYETYQEHIRYAHNAYCRIVIRHASFSAARMLATRWKRELSFEYLTEEKKFMKVVRKHTSFEELPPHSAAGVCGENRYP